MSALVEREVIGPADCPLMYRWTVVSSKWLKVLVHFFHPFADDDDYHDHPRGFVILVLSGGYDDIELDGTIDRVRRGAFRYRRPEHMHRTRVGSGGAWTICIMGPLRRAWGFNRDGQWWPWRDYIAAFGASVVRCGERDES